MKKLLVMSVLIFLYLDLVCVMSIEELFTDTWFKTRTDWRKSIGGLIVPIHPLPMTVPRPSPITLPLPSQLAPPLSNAYADSRRQSLQTRCRCYNDATSVCSCSCCQNTVKSGWNKMIAEIKKPVRPGRLGSIGKRKTTKMPDNQTLPLSSENTTELSRVSTWTSYPTRVWFPSRELSAPSKAPSIETPPEVKKIAFPEGFPETATTVPESKIRLPYLSQPPWRTIEDWQRMQRPHYVKVIRERKSDGDFEAIVSREEKLAEENIEDMRENERFGVLIFV